jgi:predicted Zn-dependent protease
MRWFVIAIFAASAFALPGCATDRVTDSTVVQWYSLEEDIEIGTGVMEQSLAEFEQKGIQVDSDEELTAKVQAMVGRLAAVSHYPPPELPWEAHLAEIGVVNAWCAPGGKIMVFRGLFDPKKGLVRTEDELAAVLGHEIAHATCRHVTREKSRTSTILVSFFPVYIAAALVGVGDLAQVAVSGGVSLYLPTYSRGQEREADEVGLTYMAKAGYDPRAAVALWKRASQREGDETSIFATHPKSGERAQNLEERLPEALELYEKAKAGGVPASSASAGTD